MQKANIKMALRPLEDKIIVEPIVEAEKVTASGLVLAGMADEKPTEGIVIAVGPGARFADGTLMELNVAVGDKVIYSKYSGTEIKHEDKDLVILPYRDIFAVIG
jgi:chaperonin GroES